MRTQAAERGRAVQVRAHHAVAEHAADQPEDSLGLLRHRFAGHRCGDYRRRSAAGVVRAGTAVPVTVRAEKRPRKSEEPARRSGRALIYRPETAAQRAARSSRFASPSAGRSDSASAGRRSGHATILVRRGFARGLLIVGVVLPLIADRGKWSRRPPRIRKMV